MKKKPDAYTKDLKPTKASSKVKVTNDPKTNKPTIARLKKSNASLLGHNNRQRVEIAKLKGEVSEIGTMRGKINGFMCSERLLQDDNKLLLKERGEARSALATAEGIIAERDETIHTLEGDVNDEQLNRECNDVILGLEVVTVIERLKLSIALNIVLALSLAATVYYLWRVG